MNQVLGTFSGQGGYFQVTANEVKFISDKPDGFVEDGGFLSENQFEEIPFNLIEECNQLYEKEGIPHIILDISDKSKITKLRGDHDESRDIKIDSILDTKFEIVPWTNLLDMPSRYVFYDSVTRHTDLFERQQKVLKYLNSIYFEITDLLETGFSQQELLYDIYQREYSYISKEIENIIIRVKPNLMIEIMVKSIPDKSKQIDCDSPKRYFFFYDPKKILDIVSQNSIIEIKRDIKINTIIK
jgi:hypothetical protein